ncbi:MAG: hypothetical protein A3D64_00995, partial [Candidatus Wildermuthbacteria bacterium RIFCSPHIGHO2_02_FULL_49_9]
RERVRQIVQEGLRLARENIREAKNQARAAAAFERIAETLRRAESMKREDLLLQLLEAQEAAPHALFLLTLGEQFYHQRETQEFYPFWTLEKDMVKNARPLHERLLGFFQKKKSPAEQEKLELLYGKRVLPYLEVSKLIERSPEGRWGLRTWPEVNPRGMRDKAYLVLRQSGQPLHFTEVASLIARMQENLVLQKNKTVLPQTVHNELIKDPRFVLIGRGTYGLADWGLTPGTVKDVMCSILRDNGKTMPRAKLIAETLELRRVKESTILLNLQDRRYFLRNGDGTYTLKT